MIGNNASLQQVLGGEKAQQKPLAPQAQQPVAVAHEPQEERTVIHRSR